MANSDGAKDQYNGLGSLKTFQVVLKNVDSSVSVDITSQVIGFSIYEDIFSPTLYGDITIKDATNLLNGEPQLGNTIGFPIVGEEYIEVTYSIAEQKNIFRRFAVYAINNISFDANLKIRNYILKFCSEEHLIDATTLIQKSWKDVPISDMVKDVLENYLKVNDSISGGKHKKIYRIQPTKGSQQIVVPNLSPLETLNLFARRSMAEKLFISGTYLFFENKNGFNFCDIEYLIQDGRQNRTKNVDAYTYYHQNPSAGEEVTPSNPKPANAYKTVMDIKQKHKFDTIEKIKNGYFESEIIVFDLSDRTVDTNVYKFLDKYKDFNALGNPNAEPPANNVYPENSLDFIKNVTQEPSSPPKKLFGIFNFNKDAPAPGKHTKTFLIPNDNTKEPTYLNEIYVNRSSYMTRLAQNMYTVDTYGDTAIGAGDVITLELPEVQGSTSKPGNDKYLSGYFLVASIHHKFTPESYHTTFDLYKNGFSVPAIATDTDDGQLLPAALFPFTVQLDSITNAGK